MLDTALAVGLYVAALVVAVWGTGSRRPDAVFHVLLVLAAAPYVLRRRAPLVVLVAASVPVVALVSLGYGSAVIGSGLILAAYTVAATRGVGHVAVAACYAVAILTAIFVVAPRTATLGWLTTNLALFAGAFAVGHGAKDRREVLRLLRERNLMTERAAEDEARRAVTEERLRIAQELHDVVGHSLSAIALQAAVGARVLDSDPEEARNSLLAVHRTSRSSLTEVRSILGILRTTDQDPVVSGLVALPRVVADLADAGLRVDVSVEGDEVPLPPGIDLAAYRVVQESLTNVLDHAHTATARVRLRYGVDALDLEVSDDGTPDRVTGGHVGHGSAGGTGLRGMRERVEIWGGSLRAGPREHGGFTVAAHLPYRGAP
jgi:signal transduction histidine kinase